MDSGLEVEEPKEGPCTELLTPRGQQSLPSSPFSAASEDARPDFPGGDDLQTRAEQLHAGSKSVHFPLLSDTREADSDTDDDLDTPKPDVPAQGMSDGWKRRHPKDYSSFVSFCSALTQSNSCVTPFVWL